MALPSDSDSREPSPPLFQGRGLTKRFGSFVANQAIDLDIAGGEVHALLGENGAGKSTLVKMITGLLQPDEGRMIWRGTPIAFAGPAEARACGIAAVSQHFALFENLTVVENIALGLDRRISVGKLAPELEQISQRYGLPLDPRREVWRLSVGERQRIEIVRALLQDPQLLILDEPTAVLTPAEADRLFDVLERLKADGRALLYISHKLDEVRRLAGVAIILRAGRVVGSCDPRQESAASMARMMVGSDVTAPKQSSHSIGGPLLSVNGLTLRPDDPHGVTLRDLSLEIRSGEIVGIAGVAGNGQDELFAALSGETRIGQSDAIKIIGEAAGSLSINQRRQLGAAFVPEQRLGHATVPTMSLSDNALLTGHATGTLVRFGLVDRGAALALVDQVSEAFDVRKASRDPEAARLSGGNLQKFIVGREILRQPRLLVVDQPSWGLDAGAASAIRQALLDLAARGAAVLVISQDLDELIEIADRIAVMFHGRLSPPRPVSEIGRDQLGLLMGGSGWPTEVRDVAGA